MLSSDATGQRPARKRRRASAGLAIALVVVGSWPVLAGTSETSETSGTAGARKDQNRWSVEFRGGLFLNRSDEASGLRPKQGVTGFPLLGWKDTTVLEIGAAYEIKKSVSLDGAVGRARFDMGADLLDFDGSGIISVPIALGYLESARLTAWFQIDGEHIYARDSDEWGRWMVGVTVGRLWATDVTADPGGVDVLGVESVGGGSQTTYGFGARGEVRLGRTGLSLGAESFFMWSSRGPLVKVRTSDESPYMGADVDFAPYTIIACLGYHF